jgi:hypothetical protein
MKSTVAAAGAIVLALAATTASAGVVINQEVTQTNQPAGQKTEQTLMIQGHKEKLVTPDQAYITDLDAGKMYYILPKSKSYIEIPFPPVTGLQRVLARQELSVGVKKTPRTDKAAGYACTDYTGVVPIAQSTLRVTQCVASDAPGAKEYVDYQTAKAQKVKGTQIAPGGDIPDGIPVLTIKARLVNKMTPSSHLPPEIREKMIAAMAKAKPFVVTTTVTKIEAKELPADTFVVPAGYTHAATPNVALPARIIDSTGAAGHGPPAKPGAPAAPAAPATH